MKLLRPTIAIAACLLVGVASAQIARRPTRHQNNLVVPANAQELPILQQDLIAAINSMKTALPIYEGNRVRSIHASHVALVLVDQAIAGAKAMARTEPILHDHVAAKEAKAKYGAQQVEVSQVNMRNGLASLQKAWKDLEVAAGSNPNKAGKMVAQHLRKAITEATSAIALHANKG